ncbi:hypothetical protein EJ07DRAFT_170585 [Lizonia empirigonia]|nr:hypothetical protein EJ07DRAFT_170585 [Lizonia empirigonia]
MTSQANASNASDMPTQEEKGSQVNVSTAVAVRSDDWAAILMFLSVQGSLLNAAFPHELCPIQALANSQYKSLEPTINKYKHASNMIKVEVELGGGARQKTLISCKALFPETEPGEASKDVKHIKDRQRPTNPGVGGELKLESGNADGKTADGIRNDDVAQQSKVATQKEDTHAEAPCVSGSSQSHKPQKEANIQDGGSKLINQSRAAHSADQKFAKTSQASTKKQSTPVIAKSSPPKASITDAYHKPYLLSAVLNEIRTPVTPAKFDPVAHANTRRPKVVAHKTADENNRFKTSNTSTLDKASKTTKQPTTLNPGAIENSVRNEDLVNPDTLPKQTALPHPTYSGNADSSTRSEAIASPPAGSRSALKDMTNKRKPVPASDSRPASEAKMSLPPKKPVIKQKIITSDGKVIAVIGAAEVTSKRQRAPEETESADRPAKRLAIKQTSNRNAEEFGTRPKVKGNKDALIDATSAPSVAKKATTDSSNVNVDGKHDQKDPGRTSNKVGAIPVSPGVEKGEIDAALKRATLSSKRTADDAKLDKDTTRTDKKLTSPTSDASGASEEKKGVAKVVKKARKRSIDAIDALIDDSINEEDAKPKKKAKTAMKSSRRTHKETKDTSHPANSDKDIHIISFKPQTAPSHPRKPSDQKPRNTSAPDDRKPTKKRRSKPDPDDDLHNFITQNTADGVILNESRRKPAVPYSKPPSSAPLATSGTKRRHTGSTEDAQAVKKEKVRE